MNTSTDHDFGCVHCGRTINHTNRWHLCKRCIDLEAVLFARIKELDPARYARVIAHQRRIQKELRRVRRLERRGQVV